MWKSTLEMTNTGDERCLTSLVATVSGLDFTKESYE